MRNIQAERSIDRILVGHFMLDNTLYDVTVLNDYAEISGRLVSRTTGRPLDQLQQKEIERYFKHGIISGVNRYIFHLSSGQCQ
jgi:hypothetical protein